MGHNMTSQCWPVAQLFGLWDCPHYGNHSQIQFFSVAFEKLVWCIYTHVYSHIKKSPFKPELIMQDFFHLREFSWHWFKTFSFGLLLYACLCVGQSWCYVCVAACPLISLVPSLPNLGSCLASQESFPGKAWQSPSVWKWLRWQR